MWLKLQFDKFKKKYLTISNEYHGNENCLRIKNSIAKERGLYGYSRLTKRELVELLQRDLPSDWVRLKFGCQQPNVHNGTFKQQFIKKNISKLIFIIECPTGCFKFSLLSC